MFHYLLGSTNETKQNILKYVGQQRMYFTVIQQLLYVELLLGIELRNQGVENLTE